MRRVLVTAGLICFGLYLALHVALGSSPVQRRVLAEIQRALSQFGLDLKIESIEFSAFTPRIYLNRVSLSAKPGSKLYLPAPLKIDKIRLEFQPLALLSQRLVIEDVSLFHPVILMPRADRFYRQVVAFIKEQKTKPKSLSTLRLEVKKVGMVDALVDIGSESPPLKVRSHSLAASVQNIASRQQSFDLDSNDLQVQWAGLALSLTRTELDVDLTENSIRVNEGILEGNGLAVHLRGASSLTFTRSNGPESLNATYDIHLPLPLIEKIPGLKAPHLEGEVISSGTLRSSSGDMSGRGTVKYQGVAIDGYRVGAGAFGFKASERRVTVSDAVLEFAGGEVRTEDLQLDMKDRFPISGHLKVRDLHLEELLESVKVHTNPVHMRISGNLDAKGFLLHPFEIDCGIDTQVADLLVLDKTSAKPTAASTVIRIKSGTAQGTLIFTRDKMAFQASLGLLGGKAQADGYVGFNDTHQIHVKGDKLSLTELGHIADLPVAGNADVTADINVVGDDANIVGNFSAEGGEVSHIVLGGVKGQTLFRNGLLTFEKLSASTGGDVQGQGYVDFTPPHTRYRFDVGVERAPVDQIFRIFQKRPLSFPAPSAGEITGHVVISGGGEGENGKPGGVSILASGDGKRFRWYDENWQSADFSVDYTPERVKLERVMLLKKSGGVELRGLFAGPSSFLNFQSHGLRLEELNHLGKAPLTGEISGGVRLEGELSGVPAQGNGELRFTKVNFRGNPLPDSNVTVKANGANIEFLANVLGDGLKARWIRPRGSGGHEELLLYCKDFDFAPFIAAGLGRDIPTLSALTATGDLSLTGDIAKFESLNGSGTLSQLKLGLRGTPMTNQEPLRLHVSSGSVIVDRFHLVGTDSQVSLDLRYQPSVSVSSSLDGTLDLQFLQPFIPGIEYGTGKVTAGLRLSGPPDRFQLLGNLSLEDGVFRLTGLSDEFRNVQAQLSLSQDRINVDTFRAALGGGTVTVEGDVAHHRFQQVVPNLSLAADRVTMKFQNALSATMSGDFTLKGTTAPYTLGGKCWLSEGHLTRLDMERSDSTPSSPLLAFDITCDAKNHLFVATDVIDAEFHGNFHLLGNNTKLGLLGAVDADHGSILFRETKFDLNSGTVKFESAERIAPRFALSGQTVIKDQSSQAGQTYAVDLQVFGTPESYKVRLTSTPPLTEGDITSLLMLGVTTRGSEGNYGDLGSTMLGQIPLKSKLQNELGVDIRINSQRGNISNQQVNPTGLGTPDLVQKVQIKKDITRKTKVSYSNTLETIPVRELKIEHALDDNFSINATATDGAPGSTNAQSVQSYGLDVIYRFPFK